MKLDVQSLRRLVKRLETRLANETMHHSQKEILQGRIAWAKGQIAELSTPKKQILPFGEKRQ